MPCSRIATSLSGSNPAFERSTEERRIEKGSASTTLSAVTVFVPELLRERERERARGVAADRDELGPGRDLARRAAAASRSVI